jgi:hypothetical protein
MTKSHSSETASTATNPTNSTFADILDNDRIRYRRKGYGLFTALLAAVGFFVFLPKIGKDGYSYILSTEVDRDVLYIISAIVLHQGMFFAANLAMNLIYWLRHPFFERYKTNNYKWPWDASPEDWSALRKKTYVTVFLNSLVLGPGLILAEILLGLVDFDFSLDTFPGTLETVL